MPVTRSEKSMEDALNSITEQLKNFQAHFDQRCYSLQSSLDQRCTSMASEVSDLLAYITTSLIPPSPPPPPPSMPSSSIPPLRAPPPPFQPQSTPIPTPGIPQSPSFTVIPLPISLKPPKLHLPFFDGTNPLDWLFQADQFFGFYQIPPDQRLPLISFYMQGDALSWFKWIYMNNQLSTWDNFIWALELRFGPSSFETHQASLFKLRQTGTVMDYQLTIEKLCNRIVGLSPETILNCFISGLRNDIQRELAVLRPTPYPKLSGWQSS